MFDGLIKGVPSTITISTSNCGKIQRDRALSDRDHVKVKLQLQFG